MGGGWVSNDEATVEYYNVLEQYRRGHQFIKEQLGVDPPYVGWYLDSFGNSQVTPTLLQKLGYSILFVGRMPDNLKDDLREQGHLQFVWEGYEEDQMIVYVAQ